MPPSPALGAATASAGAASSEPSELNLPRRVTEEDDGEDQLEQRYGEEPAPALVRRRGRRRGCHTDCGRCCSTRPWLTSHPRLQRHASDPPQCMEATGRAGTLLGIKRLTPISFGSVSGGNKRESGGADVLSGWMHAEDPPLTPFSRPRPLEVRRAPSRAHVGQRVQGYAHRCVTMRVLGGLRGLARRSVLTPLLLVSLASDTTPLPSRLSIGFFLLLA